MRLLEDIYRQQMEFLRRNISRPDLLLVPYEEKHRLLGEVVDKYQPVTLGTDNLHVMGMRVAFTRDVSRVTVALSAECLSK